MSDNDVPHPLLDGLMGHRTVVLEGKVNGESMADLWRRLLTLQLQSSDPITLLLIVVAVVFPMHFVCVT